MATSSGHPLTVLTRLRAVTAANWPGETPVEIRHASDIAECLALLPGTDVLLSQVFTRAMAQVADSLQLIQSSGAGVEHIDLAAVPPGCPVAIVYEHERAVAEWVIMAMIALNREVVKADRTLRQGNWELSYFRPTFAPELAGHTLGIIGLGRIGRQTAAFAKAFGMRVMAVTRTVPPAAEIQQLGLECVLGMGGLGTVLHAVDFVLLSLPLTDATQGLIGASALAQMRPTGSLINVGRAGLVDEAALFAALKAQQIKGAALDVWYHEPQGVDDAPMPANLPFWELENVLMSPHLAGLTTGMLRRRLTFAAHNIDRLARGEPLQNVIHVG